MDTFYRQSFLGKALMKSLASKIHKKEISSSQAALIMQKFDTAIHKVFDKSVTNNVNFKGIVKSYNNVDGVWKLTVDNFQMNLDNRPIFGGKVKIVAVAVDGEINRKRKSNAAPVNNYSRRK
ncbi:Transcription initiation factor IIA subunit 2 [Cucumispora dikerogammari]|nr:Transcription initiation factor IIA subunit 2 [Cucumispora dikerogammari]